MSKASVSCKPEGNKQVTINDKGGDDKLRYSKKLSIILGFVFLFTSVFGNLPIFTPKVKALPKKLLMVVKTTNGATTPTSHDNAIKDYLDNYYDITLGVDNIAHDLTNYDAVFISDSSSGTNLGGVKSLYRETSKPVIVNKAGFIGSSGMGMASNTGNRKTTTAGSNLSIRIESSQTSHAIAGVMNDPNTSYSLLDDISSATNYSVVTASISSAADKIAYITEPVPPSSTEYFIFSYDQNDTLSDNTTAKGKRVFIGFSDLSSGKSSTIEKANAAAKALLLRTVQWAVGDSGSVPPVQSSEKDIVAFTIPGQVGSTNINNSNRTIAFEMPAGSAVDAIPVTVTTSVYASVYRIDGAVPSVTGNNPYNLTVNFTNPVTFTIRAEDGTIQDWAVNCTIASAQAPNMPANLRVTGKTASNVSLAWDFAVGSVTGYNVYKEDYVNGSFHSVLVTSVSASTNSCTVDNLNPGNAYRFYVKSVGTGGQLSAASNVVTAALGEFSISGTRIYDPSGNEFVAKGVNINGYNTAWGGDTLGHLGLVKDVWKFNFVRVYNRIDPQYKAGGGNNKNIDYLYQVLDMYTSAGIVCMIEVHDKTGEYFLDTPETNNPESPTVTLTDLVNFHKTVAEKYKYNPYVWFNVMNEPGNASADDSEENLRAARELYLKNHQSVIKGIRDDIGAGNVIVADAWDWAQDTYIFNNDNVVEEKSSILSMGDQLKSFNGKTYNNIMFAIHAYREWVWGQSKLTNYLDRVAAKGHALIIGEYGSYTNNDTTAATEYMFKEVIPRKIGRVVWHWYGGDENDLTTLGGGHQINKTDGSKPTNLTWLGNLVWEDNHGNILDLEAPTTPANLRIASITDTSIRLEWDVSSDNLGVAHYNLYNGNSLVSTVIGATYYEGAIVGNASYYFNVKAQDAFGNLSQASNTVIVNPVFSFGKKALLIVNNMSNGEPTDTNDQTIKRRLERLGFNVTVKIASNSKTSDATGTELVFISESVNSGDVGAKFRDVAVPVISCEPFVFQQDRMGMTLTNTTGPTVEYYKQETGNKIKIQNTSHYLAAGLSGDVTFTSSDASKLIWGKPNGNAVVIASVAGDETKIAIFGYETGSAMPGLAAPARRLGFMMGQYSANALNEDGGKLFDAAVRWAVGLEVDTAAPVLTMNTIPEKVTQSTLIVTGNAFDDSGKVGISVKINGNFVTSNVIDTTSTAALRYELNLVNGVNNIYIQAVDASGNTTERNYTVNYDTSAPTSDGGSSTTDSEPSPILIVTPTPTITPTPTPVVEAGRIIISQPQVDSSGTVSVEVTTVSLEQAIEAVKDTDKKVVVVDIPEVEGSVKISAKLPAQILTVAEAAKVERIQINTGKASIAVASDALGKDALTGNILELSIKTVSSTVLPAEITAKTGDKLVYDFDAYLDEKQVSKFYGSKAVQVEIDYKLAPAENPDKVVVYYINDNNRLEIVKNGKYDQAKGKVIFNTNHLGRYAAVHVNTSFIDIASVDWAKTSIEALAARGIVNGAADNLFMPNNKITRAEFIKMVIGAFELEDESDVSTFKDVKTGEWYANFVASAQKLGIVNGYEDGNFGVNKQITRQEMAAIAYRAAVVAKVKLPQKAAAVDFIDKKDIHLYAQEAISAMIKAEIINGVGDNRFAPINNSTRAEAAKVVYGLFKFIE